MNDTTTMRGLGPGWFALVMATGIMSTAAARQGLAVVQDLLTSLHATGEVTEFYPGRMVGLEERSDILGLPDYFALEQRYAATSGQG